MPIFKLSIPIKYTFFTEMTGRILVVWCVVICRRWARWRGRLHTIHSDFLFWLTDSSQKSKFSFDQKFERNLLFVLLGEWRTSVQNLDSDCVIGFKARTQTSWKLKWPVFSACWTASRSPVNRSEQFPHRILKFPFFRDFFLFRKFKLYFLKNLPVSVYCRAARRVRASSITCCSTTKSRL